VSNHECSREPNRLVVIESITTSMILPPRKRESAEKATSTRAMVTARDPAREQGEETTDELVPLTKRVIRVDFSVTVKRTSMEALNSVGIQPSAQRLAVADYVLYTDEHPSAEQVLARARKSVPMLSRATVYNTLNLLVAKGLLRQLTLAGGRVVFDPKMERHHHFVDEVSGRIHDVAWDALEVRRVERLRDFSVSDYQVVLVGRAKRPSRKSN
jgi:Fur family transcriptional regulator, iron response regulator